VSLTVNGLTVSLPDDPREEREELALLLLSTLRGPGNQDHAHCPRAAGAWRVFSRHGPALMPGPQSMAYAVASLESINREVAFARR
jgi:hypothetical protein